MIALALLRIWSNGFQINRAVGRIDRLQEAVDQRPMIGSVGIGHTRWATHGAATTENAHPHLGGRGKVAIVHNGVIENYETLKQGLLAKGYTFSSATDSEVIAHLIADAMTRQTIDPQQSLSQRSVVYSDAVREVLVQLRGTYGLVVLFRDEPELMLAARCGSPLVIGVGKGEQFIASDTSPLIGYTDRIIYLADHQMAVLTCDNIQVLHRDSGRIRPDVRVLEQESADTSADGYEHYMLKESMNSQIHCVTPCVEGWIGKMQRPNSVGSI